MIVLVIMVNMMNLMICLQIITRDLDTIEVEEITESTMMKIIIIIIMMMINTILITPDITEEKIETESEKLPDTIKTS